MGNGKWKFLRDTSGPVLSWHTRVFTPDGHEIPDVVSVMLNPADFSVSITVKASDGFEQIQEKPTPA